MPKTKKTIFEESEAFLKTLYFFFAFPTKEMSLNDLTEEIGISKTTANRVVTILEEEGFLKKQVLGKTWRISCNQNHPYNTTVKIPYNLWIIYETEIITKIHKLIGSSRSIILFGSYRKGDDIETSDIDMGVEIIGYEEHKIKELGVEEKNISLELTFDPPWTMERMSKKGRAMLGI